jgi:hypothetical protein
VLAGFLGAWQWSSAAPAVNAMPNKRRRNAAFVETGEMKMRGTILFLQTGLLATAANSDEINNKANDWLLAQSKAGQATMLGKVVGDNCKGKTAFYQGNLKSSASESDARPQAGAMPGTENDTFWSVRCTDGRSFEVEVHPDGSGTVLECAVLKSMHAGECFKKF